MAYFSSKQDRLERGAKVAADIACAVMLATFSVVFFGWIEGLIVFAILEACLLTLDWLVPKDDAAGVAVR